MQKAVLIMMDENFLAEIDAAYPRLGYSDRATFIREAILKLMAFHGYNLPVSYKAAPSRAGKGGRPKKSTLKPVSDEGKTRRRA